MLSHKVLLSLQLQFEILSHKVLELEFGEGARRSPFPHCPTSVPPPSSSSSLVPPPAAPTSIPAFDARFLTAEQQIRYLIFRVHELEEELAHVRIDLFPSSSTTIKILDFLVFRRYPTFDENATIKPETMKK
ncbi:hypothetical protein Hanom_Chr03g00207941 [Helianthus anomalus]